MRSSNFKALYLEKVITAGGGFVYIPTGNSQERPCCTSDLRDGLKVLSAQTSAETSVAECPLVAKAAPTTAQPTASRARCTCTSTPLSQ